MSKAKEFSKMFEQELSNNIFPVKVVSGQIVTKDGKPLVNLHRDYKERALYPVELDALTNFIAELLNKNQNKFEAFYKKYRGK